MYGQRIALCEFPLLHRPLRRWDLCCLIGEGHEMACAPLCWISHRQAQICIDVNLEQLRQLAMGGSR